MNLPPQCADLLARWLVPFFLAYNIVGWWWLPIREVNRSHLRENYTKLNEQNLADLRRAFGGAWLVGLLVAIGIVAAISRFYPDLLQKENFAPLAGYVAGRWACSPDWFAGPWLQCHGFVRSRRCLRGVSCRPA
jgi:hypothetical protein